MKPLSLLSFALWFALSAGAQGESPSYQRFQFREPRLAAYRVQTPDTPAPPASSAQQWLRASPDDGSGDVELGSRVVLQLEPGRSLSEYLRQTSLRLSRTVLSNVFLLQAPEAWTALREAEQLAHKPGVLACYPVTRSSAAPHGAYSYLPNDQYFYIQWYLERRDTNGTPTGMDLNARAAWPYSRGDGVTVAVGDLGIELTHPDLAARTLGAPHFNFNDQTTNGAPFGTNASWAHGTEVAGLIAAQQNNSIGMSGVAPEAQLASWVIYTTNRLLVSDDLLMQMYQYRSNEVSIQNHSWGKNDVTLQGPTLLEQIGISNAITFGRNGRGVVMVRSAGNLRMNGVNANDNGYAADPQAIAVGAARFDGRVASYSQPGACLLLAAPSGDTSFASFTDGLFTTDLTGRAGANAILFPPPNQSLSDYVFDGLGFYGTSASAPLVAGVAALILSANTNLTYRDVQQVLIHCARHFDPGDPDLRTNGAGFRVSHNQGFGVPDAGFAVALARNWPSRPKAISVTIVATNTEPIPDDGLRLLMTGDNIPPELASIRTLSGTGPHPDVATLSLPLVDVGFATNAIPLDLTGKAALIQRLTNNYPQQVRFAAQAGAAFAVVYNRATNDFGPSECPGGDQFCLMGGMDFTTIPAVFIQQADGEALRTLFQQNPTALAQLRLSPANYTFSFTNTLICEHVAVRIKTDHPLRGDLRITLLSPQGTRSVLQAYNADVSAGPVDWTYTSTHHFYESSAGDWTLSVSDEFQDNIGSVLYAALTIEGVPIVDSDHDGLDDDWEMTQLGSLAFGPQDDPDGDGYSNAKEQIMGTDPLHADSPLRMDLSRWNISLARLSWPGTTNRTYQVWSGQDPAVLTLLTNVPGKFPVTEWFGPYRTQPHVFYELRTSP